MLSYSQLWVWRGTSKEGYPTEAITGDLYFQVDTDSLFMFLSTGWKKIIQADILAVEVLPGALADVVDQADNPEEPPPPPMA